MTQRELVYATDNGHCVNCGGWVNPNGGIWSWSVHHAIKAQTLRRRHAPEEFLTSEKLCVLLCKRCHEKHESRTAAIPLERLPERVLRGVEEIGPWAEDLLRRYHPPMRDAA